MIYINKILKSLVFKLDNYLYRERFFKVFFVLGNNNIIFCFMFFLLLFIVDLIMKYIYFLVNFV